jgi:hypothetical protein
MISMISSINVATTRSCAYTMPPNLPIRIADLDDDEAIRLVTLLAKVEGDPTDTEVTSAQRAALRDAVDAAPDPSAEAGDLARAVLRLHAQDPANRDTLAQLLNGSSPERFLNGTSIALGTAVLILLQTHLRFERDADGNWTVVIEKEAASTNLLRSVVQKYLGVGEG